MTFLLKRAAILIPAIAAAQWMAGVTPASAQTGPPAQETTPAPEEPVAEPEAATSEAASTEQASTDIFSANTFTVMVEGRLVLADGHTSFTDRGLGKTRFSGTNDGDYKLRALPIEADLIWQPRFTSTLSGNVSAAWQHDQDNDVDLLEAFVTFLPERNGNFSFAAKAGLYWPEISLEHATGGAWSTVYTLTPSAINSWVGEEVKVIGLEATGILSVGEHDISATAGVFGYNDTSGTLLSFRGWALQDEKATAFGYYELPPLNDFIVHLQEDRTRSLIEIDDRVGFYGRLEWRPPSPFTLNAFYYDNRGDPEAFTPAGQWGWRTRFLNVGMTAEIAPGTRLLAQAMTGTTRMGFKTDDVIWVHTRFRSAYALVTHNVGSGAISGRVELFDTRERGSEMSHADESEDGWAVTAAGRYPITDNLTAFVEALHVRSERGTRVNLGISPTESQTVVQAALRLKW